MVGSLGDVVFQVSANKILTFDGMEKSVSARYQKHEIHLDKPLLEFIGEDLAELSLSIRLDTNYGLNPKKQIEKLEEFIKIGQRLVFMLGTSYMGHFVIQKMSEKFTTIDNRGNLLKADLTLNLMESIDGNNRNT